FGSATSDRWRPTVAAGVRDAGHASEDRGLCCTSSPASPVIRKPDIWPVVLSNRRFRAWRRWMHRIGSYSRPPGNELLCTLCGRPERLADAPGTPSEHAPHHPVRPDARDVEYIGRDHPSLVLPEVERGRARVAPQESRAILFTERSDGERQQGVTDAAPHEVAARRHAAHLPGVRALARDAHARDAADVLA